MISSPVPYVITSATVITTDPSITTNGVTDYGKIYRGQLIDGPLSAYLFGSTSAFDASSGFDTVVAGDMGGAAFKFTSLELAGDPTVDTTNGEINLGLVGVNGITSGSPGGVLLAGIRGLLLATQNGPITLGAEISFSGLHDINIYARGSLSDLTLASDINTTRRVFLLAEHDMSVTSNITTPEFSARAGRNITLSDPAIIHSEMIILAAGQDLTWNGQISDETPLITDGDVDISAGNQISIINTLEIDRRFGGSLTGRNVSFNAGTDLTVGGNLSVFIDPTGLDSGGNVSVLAGNNILIGGDVDVVISAPSVVTATANSVAPSITIDAGVGNVTVNAGNDLSVVGSFSVSTDKSNLAAGGNISILTGNNFTVGDLLSLQTFTTAQSGDGGNIDVDVGGSLNAGNLSLVANFAVQSPQGSGENVTLHVTNDLLIHNATETGGIDMQIVTPVREVVASGANLTLNVGGNLVTDVGGSTGLFINNNINQIVNGANISGTIGGNAETDSLTVELLNQGGTINAGGNVSFAVSGDLTTHSDAVFLLLNNGSGIDAAIIDNSILMNVAAKNMTVGGSLTAQIDNSSGGVINGSATINADVADTATVSGDASLQIFGSDGATSAAINVNGGTYDVGGTFLTTIDGHGDIHFSNATVRADTVKVGVFGANGTLTIGGGTISADTLLKLYAPGSNGSIDFIDNVALSSSSTPPIIAANKVTIFNGVLVTIGGTNPASVFTNIANYTGSGGNGSTTGMFSGAGATTNPLDQAPPFDNPTSSGAFVLNTAGPITINSDLESAPSGTAGTVQLNSTTDTVTVNSRVEAAPAQASTTNSTLLASATPLPQTSSTGGNISIKSGKTGAPTMGTRPVAINISSSGQLLSLLDAAAPGPGGQITILAKGANSDVDVDGKVQADRGTVDIRHAADNGNVNLSNASIRADIVKVGALGSNGTLNIGGGTISADTTLKLYAPGSNGTVNFIADVTLTGASAKIIAGDTVKVFDSVVVTIGGSPGDIYTNHAHYSQSNGGDGTTTGIFTSSGFTAPPVTTHLSGTPPPFDSSNRGH